MARKTAKAAPAPAPEETDEGGAVRGPSEMHELFSDWLKETYDADVSPEAIFWVTSKRTAFRKSDEYAEFAEKVEQEREDRLAEKEKRAQEREAARASKDEDTDEADAPKPSRRRKAKSDPAEDEPAAEAPKPTRSRRKPAAKQADEDAEGAEKPAARPARRRRSAPAGSGEKAPF